MIDKSERTGDPNIDWTQVKEVNGVTLAFPADVIDKFLPPYDYIPNVFKDESHPFHKLARKIFYRGLGAGSILSPREGIDQEKALRQIQACLGSFQPAHQHKEAGVAYLLNNFFSRIVDEEGTIYEGTANEE